MWSSRNKLDLIIEVWEKLDCESVGETEIEAIDTAVEGRFGQAAVESPMVTARILADEGAELRHSEIMALYLRRSGEKPYEAALRELFDPSTLARALRSIRSAENLRKKFEKENDRDGKRLLREAAIEEKQQALARAASKRSSAQEKLAAREFAQWLTLWLQSPDLFENWIKLRRSSKEFKDQFGGL